MGMADDGEIKAKRDAAARARRLAWELSSPDDRERVLRLGAELEAQADALQRELDGLLAAPRVTQMQMQVQQGPATNDDGEDAAKPEKPKS